MDNLLLCVNCGRRVLAGVTLYKLAMGPWYSSCSGCNVALFWAPSVTIPSGAEAAGASAALDVDVDDASGQPDGTQLELP
jgi:hypothetical protein